MKYEVWTYISSLECRIVVGLCLLFSTLFSHHCDLIQDYSLLMKIRLHLLNLGKKIPWLRLFDNLCLFSTLE